MCQHPGIGLVHDCQGTKPLFPLAWVHVHCIELQQWRSVCCLATSDELWHFLCCINSFGIGAIDIVVCGAIPWSSKEAGKIPFLNEVVMVWSVMSPPTHHQLCNTISYSLLGTGVSKASLIHTYPWNLERGGGVGLLLDNQWWGVPLYPKFLEGRDPTGLHRAQEEGNCKSNCFTSYLNSLTPPPPIIN